VADLDADWRDPNLAERARAERARAERDALTAQLRAACGLDGRLKHQVTTHLTPVTGHT